MKKRMGFTCSYTPLPLIEAAGFEPFRVFPLEGPDDRSGRLLHDNMCPHVKRVLDRALSESFEDLEGMVFINSCDAMRRLADAWHAARPKDRVFLLDLPSSNDAAGLSYLAGEYRRLAETLFEWHGTDLSLSRIKERIAAWNDLSGSVRALEKRMAEGRYPGLAGKVQTIVNTCAVQGIAAAGRLASEELKTERPLQKGPVPVFIFGNLLFDPAVFDFFETWGIHTAGTDCCTGSKFICTVDLSGDTDPFTALAGAAMNRLPCARTMDTRQPGVFAKKIVEAAKAVCARGVISLTLKFCDPYLARLPMIKETLQENRIPYLRLESDGTLGAMGQHQTRIEAFAEMLEV